jgi:hypothetical protein
MFEINELRLRRREYSEGVISWGSLSRVLDIILSTFHRGRKKFISIPWVCNNEERSLIWSICSMKSLTYLRVVVEMWSKDGGCNTIALSCKLIAAAGKCSQTNPNNQFLWWHRIAAPRSCQTTLMQSKLSFNRQKNWIICKGDVPCPALASLCEGPSTMWSKHNYSWALKFIANSNIIYRDW